MLQCMDIIIKSIWCTNEQLSETGCDYDVKTGTKRTDAHVIACPLHAVPTAMIASKLLILSCLLVAFVVGERFALLLNCRVLRRCSRRYDNWIFGLEFAQEKS